jgi:hypothetical protein
MPDLRVSLAFIPLSLVFIPSYLKSLTIFRPSIIVADHEDRTHLELGKEPPAGRLVSKKHGNAKVVALPRLGGLHHRYEWQMERYILE